MRTTPYRDANDLAKDIAEELGLGKDSVRKTISHHRELFGRYEDITAEQLKAIERAVWADLTSGSDWPF